MKNLRILCLALCAVLSGLCQAGSSARSIIQSNYNKVSQLSMAKDKVRLDKLTRKNASASFEYVDSMKNSLDLAATLRQNNEQLARIHKFVSNRNQIVGVKQVGSDLVCTVKTSFDVFLDSAGKNRLTGISVSQDTWIKTLTGWKLRRSCIVKESSTLNGKPLQKA